MLNVRRAGAGLEVETPAKINVGLHLLGKRPDGYHELESLVMAVSLTDTLAAEATADGALALAVRCAGADAPADDSNLVLRAARLLQSQGRVAAGARLTLTKRIPAARGLGGGSSDAAAALLLLDRLWQSGLGVPQLSALGAQLGSDVPFFLNGPLAIMRGRGERLEPIASKVNVWVVLVLPAFGLATRDVYQRAKVPLTTSAGAATLDWSLLVQGHVGKLGKHLRNDLEPAAQSLNPEMLRLRGLLELTGAKCVSMTGSGSALYALAATADDARSIADALCRMGQGTDVRIVTPWFGRDS